MTEGVTVEIVAFKIEHLDELVPMWRASFEKGIGIVDPHPIEEQREYLLREVLPTNEVRVALSDGGIAGFIAATPESIAQLYVHVDHHRRGIGSQLLDWAKEQSSGRLWLFTFERNSGAQKFYESKGFKVIARGFEDEWQLKDIKKNSPRA